MEDPPGVIPAHLEVDPHRWADSMWHGPVPSLMNGKWQLTWDDKVDGRLDREDKLCTVELKEIDGQITGEFDGPVAGTMRDAIITGRFEDRRHPNSDFRPTGSRLCLLLPGNR